jgi:hypothetical protein
MTTPNAMWDLRAKVREFDYGTEFNLWDMYTWTEAPKEKVDEVVKLLVKQTVIKYTGNVNKVRFYMRARVLDGKIKKLRSAAEELEDIREVQSRYTDLDVEIDRWKKERFKSPSANALVEYFESGYSCGCCTDSIKYVRPYMIVKCFSGTEFKVFSDPPQFVIGVRGVEEDVITEFVTQMREKGISEVVIKKLQEVYKPNG